MGYLGILKELHTAIHARRLANHLEEIVHRLVGLDLPLGQGLYAVHEAGPVGHGNAQLLLHRLGIKGGGVRHPDGTGRTVQGNSQGVVHTTRIVVGVAVVAKVPLQEVATSR